MAKSIGLAFRKEDFITSVLMVNLNIPKYLVGLRTRQAMSLQIRVQDLVGEWLAVPQTQRDILIFLPILLNPHSLVMDPRLFIVLICKS